MYKLMKLPENGPLIMASHDSDFKYMNPVMVFQDDGKYKIGTFVEVADFTKPFRFWDSTFECVPSQELIDIYLEFIDDNLSKN